MVNAIRQRLIYIVAFGLTIVVFPQLGMAAQLFTDDVAVSTDGEWRTQFQHLLEPDGDSIARPGTVNRAATRLRLAPTVWLNEFVAIESQFDANARWGDGTGPFDLNAQTSPLSLSVGRAALHWQTPIGKVTVGRTGWHWGLGLFDHDGRTDLDRYGVPQNTGAQDMLRVRTAPLGVDSPLYLTVYLRQWFLGDGSGTEYVDNGWSYATAIEGGPENFDYGLLVRFDRHAGPATNLLWSDAYSSWRFWKATAALEAGFRWGRSGGQYLLDTSGSNVARRDAEWLASAGVFKFTFDRTQAGRVIFETSGFEAGLVSGDDLADVFTQSKWGMLTLNSDYKVGLLLLPELWPARRAALAAAAVARGGERERLGSGEDISKQLHETFDARSGQGGLGNVFYVYPGFGLRTDDDLRFRLNFLYARTMVPLPTLFLLDHRGTVLTFDDEYRREREIGFEVDVHLSYPLWGGVSGVLETGFAFPGKVFVNAFGNNAPVAFTLQPRLTVAF